MLNGKRSLDKSDIAFEKENTYHRFVFPFGKCGQDKIAGGILVEFDTQGRQIQSHSPKSKCLAFKTLTCYEKDWDESKRKGSVFKSAEGREHSSALIIDDITLVASRKWEIKNTVDRRRKLKPR